MIIIVPLVLLALSFVVLSIYTFLTILYRNGSQKKLLLIPVKLFPRVSILKPMRKIDDDIENNLESYFLLDYPKFEILFGVDSLDDSVVKIITALQKKYPRVRTKILVTGHSNQGNPKVHKLALLSKRAKGKLYWVSDSNTRVEQDTLKRLVFEYIQNGSKIIFSPIRATGSWSMGSIIENTYINHFVSGNVITAWKLFKKQIIVGKSMLIESETLNCFGGFSYFLKYLAEDYMMGKTYTRSKIPISSNFIWVTHINQTTTIKDFFIRMERWAKLRFHLKPQFYILEVFLNPMILALIISIFLGGYKGIIVLYVSLLLKFLLESINFLVLNKEDRRIRVISMLPFCIFLKDILLFFIYFTPFFSRTVNWRGGKIKIGKHTLIHSHLGETLA